MLAAISSQESAFPKDVGESVYNPVSVRKATKGGRWRKNQKSSLRMK